MSSKKSTSGKSSASASTTKKTSSKSGTKSGVTSNGTSTPGSAGTGVSSMLRRRLASGEDSDGATSAASNTPATPVEPESQKERDENVKDGSKSESADSESPVRDRNLSSLYSELSSKIARTIKQNKLAAEEGETAASGRSATSSTDTRLSSEIRRRIQSGAESATTRPTSAPSASETDEESESETESESESVHTFDSQPDKSICKICGDKIRAGRFKSCVYGHVICFSCFGFGDSESTEGEALSSNTCIACQRKVLDPEKNINGYPPRFLKFYLIRKLLEQDPGLCDVASTHRRGETQAAFFCIDCDAHACRNCLLDHLDGGEKSSHNLLNLLVAAYKSEKLFCFNCHLNEAVSYCPGQDCDYAVCANCVRDKHQFHGTFKLSDSQRNMLMYINKQRVVIREYRQSVDVELQRRRELRESKTEELDNLTQMIQDVAELHRKMIAEDEQKLLEVVQKHRDEIFSVYKTLDSAIERKDVILKYFENIHHRLREKRMDDDRRVDAFSFCRENEELLKSHKELHLRTTLKFEAELATMKFTKRDLVEKFRFQGNNILGTLIVKEKKIDPDRLQVSSFTLSIDVRGRNDRTKPEITHLLYLEGTDKIAIVDSSNKSVKVISKFGGVLYSKDPDVRIDYIDNGKLIQDGDRVLLAWNDREQLLIVCNASQNKIHVFTLDGKRVWYYDLPSGAGKALSLHHSGDGALYVGRSHISMDEHGGIVEIHMMLQKGRYQLLRHQDRYYIDHRPKYVTTTPSGYTIVYDGSTLVYLSKSLKHLRTEDRRHKEWSGLEASDLFMTNRGHLVIVDPMNIYADNAITILNEDGYVLGFPLASSGEEGDDIQGPVLITGDNGDHFYIVDSQADRIKVLYNG